MPRRPPPLLPVTQLIAIARARPAAVMPPGTHQSLPVPVRAGHALHVAFFYYYGEIVEPGGGLRVARPRYVALLDAPSGRFIEVRRLDEAGDDRPDETPTLPTPSWTSTQRLTPEFLTAEVKLYEALDALLPRFAARRPPGARLARDARAFVASFDRVAEPPLRSYYPRLAPEFFAWVEAGAAGQSEAAATTRLRPARLAR